MRTVLKVIWLLLCGIWLALGYLLAGMICCVLVTIPFGLAAFRIADFALWPFGRRLVKRSDAGAPSLIGDIVWIVFAGRWLAIGHIATDRARRHDHRDSSRDREPEADSGVAASVGLCDRGLGQARPRPHAQCPCVKAVSGTATGTVYAGRSGATGLNARPLAPCQSDLAALACLLPRRPPRDPDSAAVTPGQFCEFDDLALACMRRAVVIVQVGWTDHRLMERVLPIDLQDFGRPWCRG